MAAVCTPCASGLGTCKPSKTPEPPLYNQNRLLGGIFYYKYLNKEHKQHRYVNPSHVYPATKA